MKKTLRKVLSVILCVMLISGITAPAAFAAYDPEVSVNPEVNGFTKILYNLLDGIIDKLVGAINRMIPNPPSWVEKSDYVSEGVMAGTEEFLDAPADNAVWSMGYANASILTGNEMNNYYVGGSLAIGDKTVTEIYDDLLVRTVVMSDNSGRGKVAFVVVDAYGISSNYVRDIRAQLADFCAANDIVSLNISVLHQHSAVDTLGMNGNIFKALGNAGKEKPVNGISEEYMANLYAKIEETLATATESMTEGTLYHGSADFSEFVNDKRDPQVLDAEFDRFRFVPADGGRELWFTTSAIHCVGNGAGGTEITGDYPYYMEQYINETYNADFIMILTAQQGTGQDWDAVEVPEGATTPEGLTIYGQALAERFASINNETEVAPLLNVAHKETFYTISNQILVFAGKMGLITNRVVTDGAEYKVVSEIGYMEIGTDVAVVMVPGEIAAELVYGGFLGADKSWTGTEWELGSVSDMIDADKEIIVFGITNDQIGYIIPANDYMALLEPSNKSLELVATGNKTAAEMIGDFKALIDSVK